MDEKNGAKATIPLTRTRASTIALKNVVQSVIDFSFQLSAFSSVCLPSNSAGRCR
jgi:hypothetical protein